MSERKTTTVRVLYDTRDTLKDMRRRDPDMPKGREGIKHVIRRLIQFHGQFNAKTIETLIDYVDEYVYDVDKKDVLLKALETAREVW